MSISGPGSRNFAIALATRKQKPPSAPPSPPCDGFSGPKHFLHSLLPGKPYKNSLAKSDNSYSTNCVRPRSPKKWQKSSSDGAYDIGVDHVRRFEYDQASNLIAVFRGKATARWPRGTELLSSWNPALSPWPTAGPRSPRVHLVSQATPNNAQTEAPAEGDAQARRSEKQARSWALASNRVVCKGTVTEERPGKACLSKSYEYDRFGRLTCSTSLATGRPIRWQIEFDVLGRVVAMKGFDAQPESQRRGGIAHGTGACAASTMWPRSAPSNPRS